MISEMTRTLGQLAAANFDLLQKRHLFIITLPSVTQMVPL